MKSPFPPSASDPREQGVRHYCTRAYHNYRFPKRSRRQCTTALTPFAAFPTYCENSREKKKPCTICNRYVFRTTYIRVVVLRGGHVFYYVFSAFVAERALYHTTEQSARTFCHLISPFSGGKTAHKSLGTRL